MHFLLEFTISFMMTFVTAIIFLMIMRGIALRFMRKTEMRNSYLLQYIFMDKSLQLEIIDNQKAKTMNTRVLVEYLRAKLILNEINNLAFYIEKFHTGFLFDKFSYQSLMKQELPKAHKIHYYEIKYLVYTFLFFLAVIVFSIKYNLSFAILFFLILVILFQLEVMIDNIEVDFFIVIGYIYYIVFIKIFGNNTENIYHNQNFECYRRIRTVLWGEKEYPDFENKKFSKKEIELCNIFLEEYTRFAFNYHEEFNNEIPLKLSRLASKIDLFLLREDREDELYV